MQPPAIFHGRDADTGQEFLLHVDPAGDRWISTRIDAWDTWSPPTRMEQREVAA